MAARLLPILLAVPLQPGATGAPPPAVALVDPQWARHRAHLRATELPPGKGAAINVAVRLGPEGPVYRLPVAGRFPRERIDPDSGVRRAGLLIDPAPDAPVIAPAAGRVAYAGPFRGYRDVVILDHGHGWTSVLTGIDRLRVRQGADVMGGDRIGRAGTIVRLQLLRHGRDVDVLALMAALAR